MDWTPGAVAALRERDDLPFVRADSNGLVVEFNQRFETIYGWDDESRANDRTDFASTV